MKIHTLGPHPQGTWFSRSRMAYSRPHDSLLAIRCEVLKCRCKNSKDTSSIWGVSMADCKSHQLLPSVYVCPFRMWLCCSSYQRRSLFLYLFNQQIEWDESDFNRVQNLDLKVPCSLHFFFLETLWLPCRNAWVSLLGNERSHGERCLPDSQKVSRASQITQPLSSYHSSAMNSQNVHELTNE